MTQEEKELLLKDLCARTLYGVICLNKVTKEVYKLCYITSYNEISLDDRTAIYYSPDDIIPYLRPLSSMTEKEHNEWYNYYHETELKEVKSNGDYLKAAILGEAASIDWLKSHHFDYRGLIEKGLALEAPEGMYKEK